MLNKKLLKHGITSLVFVMMAALWLGSGETTEPLAEISQEIVYKEIPVETLESAVESLNDNGRYGFITTVKYSSNYTSPKNNEFILEGPNSSYVGGVQMHLDHLVPNEPSWDKLDEESRELKKQLEVGKAYTLHLSVVRRTVYLEKIEGLLSVEEYKAVEAQKKAEQEEKRSRLVYSQGNRGWIFEGIYAIGNWEKAFQDKESAQKWFDEITRKADDVGDVVSARTKLYESDVRAFKAYPSKIMRDTVLKDKNNLIEAYNRYKPINTEIDRIFAKGVTLEDGKTNFGSVYPGLRSADVTKKIDSYESEYAKLIDTYPVN